MVAMHRELPNSKAYHQSFINWLLARHRARCFWSSLSWGALSGVLIATVLLSSGIFGPPKSTSLSIPAFLTSCSERFQKLPEKSGATSAIDLFASKSRAPLMMPR